MTPGLIEWIMSLGGRYRLFARMSAIGELYNIKLSRVLRSCGLGLGTSQGIEISRISRHV